MHKNLVKNLWSSDYYYQVAKKGSLDRKHFWFRELKRQASSCEKILDLGCGEGSKLNLVAKGKKAVGVDISFTAIKKAKKQYPYFEFMQCNIEDLPFKDSQFDLVFCAFVLEHLDNPERVINEALRVSKPGGKIFFVSPNFGSPNRCSPPFKGSRIKKLVKGFLNDFFLAFKRIESLGWQKVVPDFSVKRYSQDTDATCEPYVLSLKKYLEARNVKIVRWGSLWEEEVSNPRFIQKIFKFLGKANLFPFKFWGPQLLIVGKVRK